MWSIELFKNYVYGTRFGVVSDHKALQTVLKSNKGNKTYSSRLTRWVDRLLPFDFIVTHTPGRTLGMADYLSRHPSQYEGSSIKSDEMFNNWFTINVVADVAPKSNEAVLANPNKPIRTQKAAAEEIEARNEILTVHASKHTLIDNNQVDLNKQKPSMASEQITSNSRINQIYIQANYEADKTIQKVIKLVKEKNTAVISRLPPPWREKFTSFSVDERGLLYMDQRLVIPKEMQENVLRAIHYGHAGRDAMLREAADLWWPKIHREIVERAQNCNECQRAGKNLKCLKTQKEFGKIPEAKEPNEETSIDFAGPFQNAHKQKKYLLVSVDNNSGWPEALFLPNPTAEKVIEFLTKYIAAHGIPKRIRTDPGTAFKSRKFKQLCEDKFIKHVMCPIRGHRGNGKVERMIRTINERLRINQKIVVERSKNGISNILFALRTEKGADGKSSFEKQTGRKPNTLKSAMIDKCILEKDPLIEIEPDDFSDEADSTILVRERMRGTKLEGAFKKIKGKVTGQSEHTISILPKSGKTITLSKRDIAKQSDTRTTNNEDEPTCSKMQTVQSRQEKRKKKKVANQTKKPKLCEVAEMGQLPKTSSVADENPNTSNQWFETEPVFNEEGTVKQEMASSTTKEDTEKPESELDEECPETGKEAAPSKEP